MDRAAVCLGDGANQCQPQPAAALLPGAGVICPEKRLKNLLVERFRDARTLVINCNLYPGALLPGCNGDYAACRTVFDRIIRQVPYRPVEKFPVSGHAAGVRFNLKAHLPRRGLWGKFF